jgi:hypothetical protein
MGGNRPFSPNGFRSAIRPVEAFKATISNGSLTSFPAGRNAQIALKSSARSGRRALILFCWVQEIRSMMGERRVMQERCSTASASSGMSRIPGAPPRDFERAHGLAISPRLAGTS